MLAPNTATDAAQVATPAAGAAPLLIRNLTVAYDGQPVLTDVTWTAPSSALLAIVGPNGAGKTSLIKAVLGLIPRAAGEVQVFGHPFDPRDGTLAYVPQRSTVDWDFPATALDVVVMGLYRRIGWLRPVRRADREEARVHLDTVGMTNLADRQIGALSGGQQQRVFIARALAQRASVYLLDEPFAAVDATTERIMIKVFRDLRAQGSLVVCVHHDLASVVEIFDHILLLNNRVIAAGPTSEAFSPAAIAQTYGVPLEHPASSPSIER